MFTDVVGLGQPSTENSHSVGYQLSSLGSVRYFLQVLHQPFVSDYVSNPVAEVVLLRICVKDIDLIRHTVQGTPKLFHALQDKSIMASECVLLWYIGQ